jgi:hypothetical protein
MDDRPPLDPARLHRIHAVLAQKRSERSKVEPVSFDIDLARWRCEKGGKDWAMSAAMARRLVVCWNLCDGYPTEALEDGVLRDLYVVGVDLAKAVISGDPNATALAQRYRELNDQAAGQLDTTDGRVHDCDNPGCREEAAAP